MTWVIDGGVSSASMYPPKKGPLLPDIHLSIEEAIAFLVVLLVTVVGAFGGQVVVSLLLQR